MELNVLFCEFSAQYLDMHTWYVNPKVHAKLTNERYSIGW